MRYEQLTHLFESQQDIIRQVALADDLGACLKNICLKIESILRDSGAIASILVLRDNRLYLGAAPSLPDAYNQAINGAEIGPTAGSCGTAAYTRQRVMVRDIANDPLWVNYRDHALAHGLRACFSTPFFSSQHDVLGTFAIYYPYVAKPTQFYPELIEYFSDLASLAIERDQAHQRELLLLRNLSLSNTKLQALLGVIPDLVMVLDDKGNYIDLYGARDDLLFRNATACVGRNVIDVLPHPFAEEVIQIIGRALASDAVESVEYSLDTNRGVCIFDGRVAAIRYSASELRDLRHVLWIARDVTDQKRAEENIERLAFFDLLTGLPNRRLLFDRLQQLIDRSRREHICAAVLYIDLNDFKRINDSLGHSVGDALLVQVAERLSPIKRASDTLSRIGGDEFVVLVDSTHQPGANIIDDAVVVCKRLLKTLAKPFSLGSGNYRIGASVGIAIVDGEVKSVDETLKRADSAMYAAKKLGGSNFCFYEPRIQEEIDKKLQIEREMLGAIELGQFHAFFQPQLDTVGNVVGAEALLRWEHPERGLIPPLSFIQIAEHSGLIFQLQKVVMEDTCRMLSRLKGTRSVVEDFSISINISPSQFKSGRLESDVLGILANFNVSPRHIVFEITESLLMHNKDEVVPQMHRLKDLGFRFSIDDFGTGYSSLAYLHALPLDELKIDKSFVDQIQSHQHGSVIIDSIISLAAHLRLQVIAEGVETQDQLALLAQRPIHTLQGYLFSRPLPADAFLHWVEQPLRVRTGDAAVSPTNHRLNG